MIQSVQVKDKEEVKVKQEVKQGDKVITEQDTSPLFQWIAVFPPSGYINYKYARLNGVEKLAPTLSSTFNLQL